MREKNEENLEELFGRFAEPGEAKDAARDVSIGERIFIKNPAPSPDPALVTWIKADISAALAEKKALSFRRRVYRIAALAAAFVVFASLSVRVLERGVPQKGEVAYASIIPRGIWEGEDIMVDDAELATIAAAMEQIEGEVLAVQDGEGSLEAYDQLLELESELVEIESDFWKG